MAYQNSTVSFEKMLMKFISDEDPMQSMLKWLCERLMEAEVENKLCAEKSERNHGRLDITVRQYRGSGEAETACPDQETDALTA